MTTLDKIKEKVRKVTARPDVTQITDDDIEEYVNTFYLYDMPETLRLFDLKDSYYFTTEENIDEYDFSSNSYVSINPPAYCNGYKMVYLQDQEQFFRMWPKLKTREQVATGDGTTGPYAFTVSNTPFLRSDNTPIGSKGNTINVVISASDGTGTQSVYDDGTGSWENGIVGNISYTTGVGTVTFSAIVPAGEPIYAQVHSYSASRPTTILFFKDKFTIRPVPDGAYLVELEAYRTPTALLNDTDSPELNEWWQLLAYGASLKIFTDYGDFDQYQAFRAFYEEQLLLCHRRTIKQYANQRTATIYSPPNGPGPCVNYWPGY